MKNGFEKALELIKNEITELEAEWDRLDSQGTGTERQREISTKLEELNRTKEWAEGYLNWKNKK